MGSIEAQAVYQRYRNFLPEALDKVDTPADDRKVLLRLTEGFTLAPDVTFEAADIDGVPGEWIRTSNSRDDTILLYLHGGGYITGCVEAHRHMIADIARGTRTTGLGIDYALAPERPFPQAIEDVVRSYRYLLREGFTPDRIIVAGDSAGGGLTLALMISLKMQNLPQPAAVWVISPISDCELTGESNISQAHLDPIVLPPLPQTCINTYLAGASPRDPLASPIHADFTGFPPMRIDVGSHETLLDDSLMVARRAAIADVHVELRVWPEMVHVFPYFAQILSEGREAIKVACAFLSRHLPDDIGTAGSEKEA